MHVKWMGCGGSIPSITSYLDGVTLTEFAYGVPVEVSDAQGQALLKGGAFAQVSGEELWSSQAAAVEAAEVARVIKPDPIGDVIIPDAPDPAEAPAPVLPGVIEKPKKGAKG